MNLNEKIASDLTRAMKAGEKLRLETLRTLRAALMEKAIEKRGSGKEILPEDELAVLSSAAKKRRESIDQFRKGGRMDLVEQEEQELKIIQEYLPKQLSLEELEAIIKSIVMASGAASPSDFAKVMPAVMKEVKGKADGRTVQEMVKKALGA
jgi:uncharacterized protein YqeY